MGNINNANLDYILKWEGGLSKHEKDSAAFDAVPDGTGYHTNKGITWTAWKQIFGTDKESVRRFYEMSKEDWKQVYKSYWDGVKAESIESDLVAEFMADFAWGSGVGGANRQLQYFLRCKGLKVAVDGITGKNTLNALNGLIKAHGEKWVFESLYWHRIEFLRHLKSFKHFGKGWINRLEDFYQYALKQFG